MKRHNWLGMAVILLFASISNWEPDALAVQSIVAAGESHTVGLRSDGTVVATKAIDVSGWTGIVQVAAGYQTVGLKSDGTVVATGYYDVSGWTGIVQVAAGGGPAVGLGFVEHIVGL